MLQNDESAFNIPSSRQNTGATGGSEGSHTLGSTSLPSCTFPPSTSQRSRESAGDECRRKLESISREYLGSNITYLEALQRGLSFISEKGLPVEEGQNLLQGFFRGIDKGKERAGNGDEERRGRRGSGFVEQFFSEAIGNRRDGEVGNEETGNGEFMDRGSAELDVRKEVEEDRSRKRVREEEFPWFEEAQRAKQTLTVSKQKTRNTIQRARGDVSQVVTWARDAPGCPRNFPESEWNNLFRGNAVNLDVVYSSLNAIRPVSHNIAKLGKLEIYDAEVEPIKRVETAGQWNSAWTETTEATVFAFPHRRSELDEYRRYMQNLFDSVISGQHPKVILYDKAIRNLVGGGQTIGLTDFPTFHHLQTTYLHPFGVEADREYRKRKKSKGVCHRFNGGTCNVTGCEFRHVCGGCGSKSHGRVECPREKSGTDPKA
jgi:hypothetical protein